MGVDGFVSSLKIVSNTMSTPRRRYAPAEERLSRPITTIFFWSQRCLGGCVLGGGWLRWHGSKRGTLMNFHLKAGIGTHPLFCDEM